MSGSRTDWFPERLTTQAGVSGVASSSAITASIPILLLCKGKGAPTASSHWGHPCQPCGMLPWARMGMLPWAWKPCGCLHA